MSARGEFDVYGFGTQAATGNAAEVDRLYLRLASGETQVTLGRQRIPWGNGTAFAPADIFNPPNPLDPGGPRRGADGVMVRRALGPLGYVAAAAAYVNPVSSVLPIGGALPGTAGPTGGLTGSAKLGTHAGHTDLDLGAAYNGVDNRHVAFAEARGDLGVGWHASLARYWADGAAEQWAGAAGVDYSYAGKLIGMVEYAAGPAPGDMGLDGQSRQDPRWAVGATYLPSEVTSLGAHLVLDTAPGLRSVGVVTLSQTLGSALDLSLRLAYPFGEGSEAAAAFRGAGELKLRYSF